MRRIQTMHKIRGERRSLFHRIDRSGGIRIRKVNRLQRRHDLFSFFLSIRLDDRKPERGRPNHTRHLFLPDTHPERLADGFRLTSVFGCGARSGERRDTFGRDGFGDQFRTAVQPCLDLFR